MDIQDEEVVPTPEEEPIEPVDVRVSINEEIALVIDSKYTIDDQIALLRQKDEKPEEYQAFYDFCEEVKRKVKESRKEDPEPTPEEDKGSEDQSTDPT